MIENLGPRGDNHAARFGDTLEVRGKDLHLCAWSLAANFVDDVDEGLCSAKVVVVTVDARDDGVRQT